MRRVPHTEYNGPRGVGIRMIEPLLPGLGGPYAVAEEPSLQAYHLFDKAHLVMLTEQGLVPRQDGIAMLRALRGMEAKGIAKMRREVGGGMHSGEQFLVRGLGYDVGGRIHLGRSTGDLGAIARRIRQRERLLELLHSMVSLRTTVLTVAAEHLDTVMPGYTGSQHAQPTTLGHQLMAWGSVLERHTQRALQAYARVNQSPAGAAILTGSSFPLDRHRTADLMGFDGVIKNTFDAILYEDDSLESATVAVMVQTSLSKWANDVSFWSTSEASFVDVPDRFCGTSSIMMQKKNPAIFSSIRASAAESVGSLVTTFMGQNAPTGEFTTDGGASLQRAFDRAVQGLDWFNQFLPAMIVNKDRMLDIAGRYWAQGTDVAAALVKEKGLPWRTAHQIIGIVVRYSYERGVTPAETTPEIIDEAAVEYMGEPVGLTREALQKSLDPTAFVQARTLYGGPAPSECRQRLQDYHHQLGEDKARLVELEGRLQAAAHRLEAAIDALIG